MTTVRMRCSGCGADEKFQVARTEQARSRQGIHDRWREQHDPCLGRPYRVSVKRVQDCPLFDHEDARCLHPGCTTSPENYRTCYRIAPNVYDLPPPAHCPWRRQDSITVSLEG